MVAVPIPPPPPPPVEVDTLLNPKHGTKPQLFAPVWMDEIQNNKIFNRQKSINEDLAGSDNHIGAALVKNDDDDVSQGADHIENSRTESDQEEI